MRTVRFVMGTYTRNQSGAWIQKMARLSERQRTHGSSPTGLLTCIPVDSLSRISVPLSTIREQDERLSAAAGSCDTYTLNIRANEPQAHSEGSRPWSAPKEERGLTAACYAYRYMEATDARLTFCLALQQGGRLSVKYG